MQTVIPSLSRGIYLNSRRHIIYLYTCILIYLNTPLNTQNKPIFSNLRIAVSLCGKRTQASSLKPRASENKPIQTHFHRQVQKIRENTPNPGFLFWSLRTKLVDDYQIGAVEKI